MYFIVGYRKMDVISLKQFSEEDKLLLLQELGYQTDGTFVLDKKGGVVKDRYIDVSVCFDRMLIFPGSTIILDNNEISIARYLEEYGDKF